MPQFNKSCEPDEKECSAIENDNMVSPSELPSTSSTASKPVAYTKQSRLPVVVDELKRAGNEFMENEKYLQAINQYSDCIKFLPNHPIFYLNRATGKSKSHMIRRK